MLYSRTRNDWDDAFVNGRRAIMDHPALVNKLTEIYNDPSQFVVYFLYEEKGGSLGTHGNSHSEQNYGSIVAYLGQGDSLSIMEQISHLIMRH